MNINEILNEMNIPHKCIGNRDFKTLGLTESPVAVPYCSFIADLKYAQNMNPNISVVLITDELADKLSCGGLCIVDDPRKTFFAMHNYLAERADYIREPLNNRHFLVSCY